MISAFLFNVLWLARMGTIAHWSYLIGTAVYPRDTSGGMMLSASIFGFLTIGTLIPACLFPKVKLFATALSVPPQLHMLFLLHKHVTRRFDNDTVTKSVQAYTAVTLISTLWTIYTLIW